MQTNNPLDKAVKSQLKKKPEHRQHFNQKFSQSGQDDINRPNYLHAARKEPIELLPLLTIV
jgi:hypothetical protein